MAFTLPNGSDAFDSIQGMPDAVDFAALAQGVGGEGVVSGCAVSAQSPAAMAVNVGSGTVRIAGTDISVTSGSVNISAAHATLPRIDLVVVNSSGTKSVQSGTAATVPTSPAIPASTVPLAMVLVKAAVTSIVSGAVTDKRLLLPGPTAVSSINVRVYTSNDTWSKPAGLVLAHVKVVGAGGGGGGAAGVSGSYSAGAGGGGGGYAEKFYTADDLGSSEAVVVGAAGTAGANTGGDGGTGGDSTFGTPTKLTGSGGVGGGGAATTGTSKTSGVGGDGGSASGGNINIPGGAGHDGHIGDVNDGNGVRGGMGGSSHMGFGAKHGSLAGSTGGAYGGGGSGAMADSLTGTDYAGGAGAAGVVIVTEFLSQ